jgi:uncharacterized protein (DUF1697 family)
VGRAKRIAMTDLRQLIADLGYADVRTVLNSGNVIFSGPLQPREAISAAIEEALVLKLGVAARTLVLDADTLAAIVAGNPLIDVASDHAQLLVFIVPDSQARDSIAALCERDWASSAMALGEHAVYVWCPDGVLGSPGAAALGKSLGDATTSRNWATLLKLHALCSDTVASDVRA